MARETSDPRKLDGSEETPLPPTELPSTATPSVTGAAGPTPEVQFRFGDYELLTEIGRGGMGAVYIARQISLGRNVAVKMILGRLLANDAAIERFRREAQDVARLDHPNIVPIYEIGEYQGQHWFSMKLIHGASLSHSITRFRTNHAAAAELLAIVARAVHHAHEQGIVHRDLKPGNILLDEHGQPHVGDFGLAKRLDDDTSLSTTGMVVGTASYMAPEQARAETELLSPATDVYSLGSILYEMLTGRPPFKGETALAVLDQVVNRDPDPPRKLNPEVPPDLETICLKCLDKRPARRYGTAAALAQDLDNWREGKPIAARPVRRAERLWLWCRRKPALAASVAAAAVFLVVAAVMAAARWHAADKAEKAELVVEKEQAERQAQETIARNAREAEQRKDAEARKEREARQARDYVNDLRKARRAWEEADFQQARELLDAYRPQAGATDFRGWEWQFLDALTPGRELKRICRVTRSLSAMTWSPDSQRLAGILDGDELKIWDGATGQEKLTLGLGNGSNAAGEMLFWSPDGQRLAMIERGGSVTVLDAVDGRKVSVFENKAPAADKAEPDRPRESESIYGFPLSVSWSADSQRYVTLGRDRRTAVVCDANTGRVVHTLGGHSGEVRIAKWSPDGKLIVTGGLHGTLKVWDAPSGKEAFILAGPDEVMDGAVWRPDGQEFATTSHEGYNGPSSARIWDIATRKERLKPAAPENRLREYAALRYSRDGRRIAALGESFFVWDTAQGGLLGQVYLGDNFGRGTTGGLSPDLTHYVFGPTIHAVETTKEVDELSMPDGVPFAPLSWSPDGARVAVRTGGGERGDGPQMLSIWTPYLARRAQENWSIVPNGSFTWSPAGGLFATMPFADNPSGGALQLQIGDAARRRLTPVRNIRSAKALEPVEFTSLDAAGKLLALVCRDASIQVVDAATGAPRTIFRNHSEETTLDTKVLEVIWSPSGRWVCSADSAGRAWVWDPATGQPRFKAELGPRGQACCAAAEWSPDEKELVVAVDGGTRLRFLDAATGKESRALAPYEPVFSMAWRPKAAHLAIATQSGVRLWDLAGGQHEVISRQAAGPLFWSRDGDVLVLGTGQRGVRLWYAADRALGLAPLFAAERRFAQMDTSLRVAYSPDARTLAVVNLSGEIVTVQLDTGEVIPSRFPNLCRVADLPVGPGGAPRKDDPQRSRSVYGLSLGWTADSPRVALVSPKAVEVWDSIKDKPIWSQPQPQATERPETPKFREYAWSPDGKRLATADSENIVRLWDPATGRGTLEIPAPAPAARGRQQPWIMNELGRRALTWRPDGKQLAWAMDAATIEVCDSDTGKIVRVLGADAKPAKEKEQPGKQVAKDGPPGFPNMEFGGGDPAGTHFVFALAWSADGSRLAAAKSAGEKGTRISIWELATGRESLTVTGEWRAGRRSESSSALAWSPDGQFFALGDAEQVQTWEAQTGREAVALRGSPQRGGMEGQPARLTWSGDGKRLIAQTIAAPDSGPRFGRGIGPNLVVWDVQSRQEILSLSGSAASYGLSPDGRWLFTGALLKSLSSRGDERK
jgi:WD40 repeat protein